MPGSIKTPFHAESHLSLACCILGKRRLLADAVNQPICPKVRKHSMQGRHSAKYGTRHGEAHSVQQVFRLIPDALGAAGVGQIGFAHVLHPSVEAERVPALVQTQTDIHPDERQRAEEVSEGEGPSQRGV